MNVVLKLSKLCNLRCTYCYEYEHLANPARMPITGLAHFFRSLAEWLDTQDQRVRIEVALHGGEPLLLPVDYLTQVMTSQAPLRNAGHPVRNTVQSNLYRMRRETLRCLETFDVGLGVSIDVHGQARVDASGRCAEAVVDRHLRDLLDSGLADRIDLGGISVLHAGNVDQAVATYQYFAELGLNYRILPIFSMQTPEPRMRSLMLPPARIVEAFRAVLQARLADGAGGIRIEPLEEYLQTAGLRQQGERRPPVSDKLPWSLIVDTQGDAYLHADAYSPGARLGNVFSDAFSDIMGSSAYAQALRQQHQRTRLCEPCPWGAQCTRLPMAQALFSERTLGADGQGRCAVARPFLQTLDDWLGQAA